MEWAAAESLVRDASGDASPRPTQVRPGYLDDASAGERVGPSEGLYAVRAFQRIACRPEYRWDCGWATATVACESGFDAGAIGEEWYEGELWYFIGWWQIAVRAVAATPELVAALQDPERNTLEAHLKYAAAGAAPWPVCGRP